MQCHGVEWGERLAPRMRGCDWVDWKSFRHLGNRARCQVSNLDARSRGSACVTAPACGGAGSELSWGALGHRSRYGRQLDRSAEGGDERNYA